MSNNADIRVSQEDIPSKIEEFSKLIKDAQTSIKLWRMCIEMIQEQCDHHDTYSGDTWGRWPYTKCNICGKEW